MTILLWILTQDLEAENHASGDVKHHISAVY